MSFSNPSYVTLAPSPLPTIVGVFVAELLKFSSSLISKNFWLSLKTTVLIFILTSKPPSLCGLPVLYHPLFNPLPNPLPRGDKYASNSDFASFVDEIICWPLEFM